MFRGGLLPTFSYANKHTGLIRPARLRAIGFVFVVFRGVLCRRVNENQTTKPHEPGITNPVNEFKHVIAF